MMIEIYNDFEIVIIALPLCRLHILYVNYTSCLLLDISLVIKRTDSWLVSTDSIDISAQHGALPVVILSKPIFHITTAIHLSP